MPSNRSASDPCYQEKENGLWLFVRVQPRASADRVEGVVEGQLKVRLSAPPVDSAANEALVGVIARWLGVSRSTIQLVRGERSREKTLAVRGEPATLAARVMALVASRDS